MDVKRSVLLEHSVWQMFNLVDRVEDYPKFLPWCSGVDLIERTENKTAATLHINYHGIKANFSTENTKIAPSLMEIRLIKGPFTHLNGTWIFKPLGEEACKIEFDLHYEFSNALLEKIVGPVFAHIASTFVESFVKRANQIYAK